MSNRSETLPVGVVMPVLNARSELPRHLESMREWLDGVAEVVVVDSHSEDGTMDFLKEHLRHPGVKFIDHPRGLYPSWNRGIAELEAEYFLVSTLGDTTSGASIRRMHESAVALGTDVLVGLPTLVDGEGRPLGKRWPLHEMVAALGITGAARIDGWSWLAWSLMYLPATPIGSSASNLYRTAFMKGHPFSADYGRIGDSAWALRHSFAAKFGVEPRAESTFWVHGAPPGIQRQYAEVVDRFADLVTEVLAERELAGDVPPPAAGRVCEEFQRRSPEFRRYFHSAAEYRELKAERTLGAKLRALKLRFERQRIRRGTLRFRERARAELLS